MLPPFQASFAYGGCAMANAMPLQCGAERAAFQSCPPRALPKHTHRSSAISIARRTSSVDDGIESAPNPRL
ncbi:hypothetical protein [Acidocella sp.]|uniref:hypothetical protein n=1 Tax=Acidocella sp. TaxID=50710 RepID=UPI002628B0B6|nr:hypothetical protein [Acidocella sp.]